MKNLTYIISSLFVASVFFTSCEKSFDDPTVKTVSVGSVKTIAEVRAMYVPGETVRITEDLSVYGVVTIDETTGNLYKESYITDATGNLYIRFISGSNLFTGDSVLINLNRAKILKYNQMLQVDSLHPDNSVVKLSTQNFQSPEVITISSLLADLEASQGKLIKLDNIRFVEGGLGLSYADGATQTAGSRNLINSSGDLIEVRTSGYANFADDTIPSGVGSFIGIVAQYNSDLQLLIRDPRELNMTGAAPITVISKDFEDGNLTSGGWTTQTVSGSCPWGIFSGANSAAKITNNGNFVCETWLISPSMDLTGGGAATLEFKNTIRYDSGPQLELMISSDYDGTSLPATATWTSLTSAAIWDVNSSIWNFVSSGPIDLSAFNQPGIYVAFKFTGTNSTSVTWEVDDININK